MQTSDPTTDVAAPPEAAPLSIRTVGCFLIGDRRAIERITSSHAAMWIGAILVLSAGLAREYDQEYLLREPWYLLLPLAASLAVSIMLFVVIGLAAGWRTEGASVGAAYRSLLTLFWMTAPLAWLYAIPSERFLDPVAATSANLWTLAIVAVWRVALMTRVVSVFARMHPLAAFFVVMLPADVAALALNELSPVPLPAVMGGVQPSPIDSMLWSSKWMISGLATVTLPVWIIGVVCVIAARLESRRLVARAGISRGRDTVAASLKRLAVGSLAIWLIPLPFTQREQENRWVVESRFGRGDIRGGLAAMSEHERRDFPPLWQPPGRYGYSHQTVNFFDVVEIIADDPPVAWVREFYVDQFNSMFRDHHFWHSGNEELPRAARVVCRLPEGPAIAHAAREALDSALGYADEDRPEYLEAIRSLNELADRHMTTTLPASVSAGNPAREQLGD